MASGRGNQTPYNNTPAQEAVAAAQAGIPKAGATTNFPWKLQHRVNHPVAGSLQIPFFGEPGINQTLEQANQIPSGVVLIARTLRVKFVYGVNRDGTRSRTGANGAESMINRPFVTAVESATVAELHDRLRETFAMGRLRFALGQKTYLDCMDLCSFPDGGALVTQGGAYAASAATAPVNITGAFLGGVSNGAPMFQNAWSFGGGGLTLMGGQQFSLTLGWQALVPFNAVIVTGNTAPNQDATAANPCGHWLVTLDCDRVE